jgi:hypothetical protein
MTKKACQPKLLNNHPEGDDEFASGCYSAFGARKSREETSKYFAVKLFIKGTAQNELCRCIDFLEQPKKVSSHYP